jgi:hypothetical protein
MNLLRLLLFSIAIPIADRSHGQLVLPVMIGTDSMGPRIVELVTDSRQNVVCRVERDRAPVLTARQISMDNGRSRAKVITVTGVTTVADLVTMLKLIDYEMKLPVEVDPNRLISCVRDEAAPVKLYSVLMELCITDHLCMLFTDKGVELIRDPPHVRNESRSGCASDEHASAAGQRRDNRRCAVFRCVRRFDRPRRAVGPSRGAKTLGRRTSHCCASGQRG